MRHFINLLSAAGVALLLSTFAYAETISPQDAPEYVGSSVTVEGVVSQVATTSSGTIFINFGGRFPNHVFYAVIFRNNSNQFSGVGNFEGRAVAISGVVEWYKGKPQIIVSRPDQIELR